MKALLHSGVMKMSAIHALAAGAKNVIVSTSAGRSNATAHDLRTRLHRDYRLFAMFDASALVAADIVSNGNLEKSISSKSGIIITNLETATLEVLAVFAEIVASRSIHGNPVFVEMTVIVTTDATNARIQELAKAASAEIVDSVFSYPI